MIKVVIIGSGNLAQHLIVAFLEATEQSKNIDLVQVHARDKQKLVHLLPLTKITSNLNNLKEAHIYIIAVSDNAIETVSKQIPFQNKLVVHTSGAVSMDVLDSKNQKGVFYPLQTFSKNKKVDFKNIPICLEAQETYGFEIINSLAKNISNNIYKLNSDQRKALHLAAVFVNNFTNHMFVLGEQLCNENQIPFKILHSLIQETAQKINTMPPLEAQTGPAVRHDSKTIALHEQLLKNENQLHIYKILTQSIQDNGKKL